VALNHNNLENYYTVNFSLIQHHKYSLTDIENMIPFERDIYVEMLVTHLKKIEEEKQKG
jgi:hypothetical protein